MSICKLLNIVDKNLKELLLVNILNVRSHLGIIRLISHIYHISKCLIIITKCNNLKKCISCAFAALLSPIVAIQKACRINFETFYNRFYDC